MLQAPPDADGGDNANTVPHPDDPPLYVVPTSTPLLRTKPASGKAPAASGKLYNVVSTGVAAPQGMRIANSAPINRAIVKDFCISLEVCADYAPKSTFAGLVPHACSGRRMSGCGRG